MEVIKEKMLELIWCHKKRESLVPPQLATMLYDVRYIRERTMLIWGTQIVVKSLIMYSRAATDPGYGVHPGNSCTVQ
jgi:hypothetical protein